MNKLKESMNLAKKSMASEYKIACAILIGAGLGSILPPLAGLLLILLGLYLLKTEYKR
jgi:hypothetical protein